MHFNELLNTILMKILDKSVNQIQIETDNTPKDRMRGKTIPKKLYIPCERKKKLNYRKDCRTCIYNVKMYLKFKSYG